MVQWTADKDQIVSASAILRAFSLPMQLLTHLSQILKGIVKFHDIKSSAPLLKYLAEQIGGGECIHAFNSISQLQPTLTPQSTDCTPKAVSHRLNNIRNYGKPLANGDSATSTPTKAATTPKTPASRSKSTATKKKKAADSDGNSDALEGLQEEAQSPSINRKRARETPKKSYAEPDSSEENEGPAPVPMPKRQRVKSEPEEDLDFGLDLGDVANDEV